MGAFTSRYGATGEYDEGRYGTPLIARVNGVGERDHRAGSASASSMLMAEEGARRPDATRPARRSRPTSGTTSPNPNAGTTSSPTATSAPAWRTLAHAGPALPARLEPGRPRNTARRIGAPDGELDIFAADLRADDGPLRPPLRCAARTPTREVRRAVSRIISVLNTRGGPGLIHNYLGPNSNGNGNADAPSAASTISASASWSAIPCRSRATGRICSSACSG